LEALTEHAMLRLETEAQDALKAAADNFPGPLGPLAAFVMRVGCFPLGNLTRPYEEPRDALTKEVSRLITTPSGLRDFFAENLYLTPEGHGQQHQMSDLVRALPVCCEADRIASLIRREKRMPTVEEADIIARADALRDVLIQVDVFDHHTDREAAQGRPALHGTNDRLANTSRKRFIDEKDTEAA